MTAGVGTLPEVLGLELVALDAGNDGLLPADTFAIDLQRTSGTVQEWRQAAGLSSDGQGLTVHSPPG